MPEQGRHWVSREIELLTEIRDLLEVIAEPALAKRDAKRRASLRNVIGSSDRKAKAALLMDGTRSQSAIAKESGIDQGDLSRLVKALVAAQLLAADAKTPKLVLKIPSTFFGDDVDG
jgi:DNA-binding MarR family transcriptional regulator